MPTKESQNQVYNNTHSNFKNPSIVSWTTSDVEQWLYSLNLSKFIDKFCKQNGIDGLTLLLMKEDDLRQPPLSIQHLVDIKKLWYHIRILQCNHDEFYSPLNISTPFLFNNNDEDIHLLKSRTQKTFHDNGTKSNHSSLSPTHLLESNKHNIYNTCQVQSKQKPTFNQSQGENRKLLVSFFYALISGIWTSFIMVVVHNRVPNVQKYPPLPDLFLDNIPHISWAFALSEYITIGMAFIFILILIFHKYWNIILRRFFALSGTIFFLRSITMLVTSLSVPGHHLDCTPLKYGTSWEIFFRCIEIFLFQGLAIQGVRSCGDYMFSGHTVVLTLLNHCITEYTTSDFYVVHLMSWFCNIFGMILILAAHEHYSIDVFIAFFLTSRLFLYYHSLANNVVLHSRSDNRLSIWFPMFSYFEKNIQSMVPNIFRVPWPLTYIFTFDENNDEENDPSIRFSHDNCNNEQCKRK